MSGAPARRHPKSQGTSNVHNPPARHTPPAVRHDDSPVPPAVAEGKGSASSGTRKQQRNPTHTSSHTPTRSPPPAEPVTAASTAPNTASATSQLKGKEATQALRQQRMQQGAQQQGSTPEEATVVAVPSEPPATGADEASGDEAGERTPEPSPPPFETRHPLRSAWTLYHAPALSAEIRHKYGNDVELAAKESVRQVETFHTVEEMWPIVDALPPSKLKAGDFIMYFRCPCNPQWEDEAFKAGGRFFYRLEPTPATDEFFSLVVMHVLGEQVSLECGFDMCSGLRVGRKETKSSRKEVNVDSFIRLEVWITDCQKQEPINEYMIRLSKSAGIHNLHLGVTNEFKPFFT